MSKSYRSNDHRYPPHPLFDPIINQVVDALVKGNSKQLGAFTRSYKIATSGPDAVNIVHMDMEDDLIGDYTEEYSRYDIYQVVESTHILDTDIPQGTYALLWRFDIASPTFIVVLLNEYNMEDKTCEVDATLVLNDMDFIDLLSSCMLVEFAPEGLWE